MRHIYAKSIFFSILTFSAVSVNAQSANSNNQNSPYSRFGIGELRNPDNTLLKGMGSISSAYSSGNNVNTDNPASYGSLQQTTYEGAGEGDRSTVISSTGDRYKTGMATVSYMDIGIPLGKHAGMALGLRPYSRVYYQLNDTAMVDTFGTGVKSYLGNGTLSQGFIGFAGKVKGFSLGFNFSYIFGSIQSTSSLEPLDITSNVISSRFYSVTRIGGIYWNAGAMYEHTLTKKLGIRVGGTVNLTQELAGSRDQIWIGYKYQADTAYKSTNLHDNITIPMKYSAGIMLISTDNWNAGIDYTATKWSQYRSYGVTDSLASSAYKVSIGSEYTPNPASTKFLNRVTYRLGAYYGTDPVMLRNTQLDYYALTAGMSFPFRKNVARIHTSIEVGSRGTNTNGLLRENFVKFGLGFSFNDKWFIKRKYD